MADDIKVIINTILNDKQFKAGLKRMGQDTKKFSTQAKSGFSQFISGFAGALTPLNQGLELARKFGEAVKVAFDLSKEFQQFRQSAEAMATQFGTSVDTVLEKLGEASDNTVSQADLIAAANRAMSLNVTRDVDQMAKLLEVARIRGRAMGIDTTQAFNDIASGIGRASPLVLDNLGIITKGWADEARAAGKAFDAQFILNKVLADGEKILAKTGKTVLTEAEKFQKFEAAMKDARLELGKAATAAIGGGDGFKSLGDTFKEVAEGITDQVFALRATFGGLQGFFRQLATNVNETFFILVDSVRGQWEVFSETAIKNAEIAANALKAAFTGKGIDAVKAAFRDLQASNKQALSDSLATGERYKEQLAELPSLMSAYKTAYIKTWNDLDAITNIAANKNKKRRDLANKQLKANTKAIDAQSAAYNRLVLGPAAAQFDQLNKQIKLVEDLIGRYEKEAETNEQTAQDISEARRKLSELSVQYSKTYYDFVEQSAQNRLNQLNMRIDQEILAQQRLYDTGLISEQEYQERLLQIRATGAQKTIELNKKLAEQRQASFQKGFKDAKGFFGEVGKLGTNLYELEKQRRLQGVTDEKKRRQIEAALARKYFGLQKSLALGNAIVNTAEAVTKALTLGFPLAIPAVALATAQGAVQIATIGSQQVPGFAKGGRPTPGIPALVGEAGPEVFVPDTAGTVIPNSLAGQLGVPKSALRSAQAPSMSTDNRDMSTSSNISFAGASFNLPGITNPREFLEWAQGEANAMGTAIFNT